MTHAQGVLREAKEHATNEALSDGLRERFADRAEEMEAADGTHDGVPVNILKEWRGGSLLSIRYLWGGLRGEVHFVDADEVGEWDREQIESIETDT